MRVTGITFGGTSTQRRGEMTAFVTDVLGLTPVEGVDADMFVLADGSQFAVASAGGLGTSGRSLGFVVEDLDAATDELRAAGVPVDAEVSGHALSRYIHFTAPDGHVYELVEHRDG